jgi:hypothetical protein
MQSVPITTNVMSSNPAYGKVCLIQHYVIKFVNDWFSPGTPVSSTNKTDHYDINWNIVESRVKHHNPTTTYIVAELTCTYVIDAY